MVLHLRILPPGLRLSLESWGSSPVCRDSSLDYYTDISEMLRPDCSWITRYPDTIPPTQAAWPSAASTAVAAVDFLDSLPVPADSGCDADLPFLIVRAWRLRCK